MDRLAFSITPAKPGSDLAAETAAAMASASILLKSTNPTYSENLLKRAKQLFEFADKFRGSYHESIPQAADFYRFAFHSECCEIKKVNFFKINIRSMEFCLKTK